MLVEGKPTTAWDPIRLRRRIGYVIQDVGSVSALHGGAEHRAGAAPGRMGRRKPSSSASSELLAMLDLAAGAVSAPLSAGAVGRAAAAGGRGAGAGGEPAGAAVRRAVRRARSGDAARDPAAVSGAVTRSLGKTSIFVTHDPREAMLLATRIALLRDGRLEAAGRARRFPSSATGEEAQAFRACLRMIAVSARCWELTLEHLSMVLIAVGIAVVDRHRAGHSAARGAPGCAAGCSGSPTSCRPCPAWRCSAS